VHDFLALALLELNHFAGVAQRNGVWVSTSPISSAMRTSSIEANFLPWLWRRAALGEVVKAEHHVLRRDGDGRAVRGERMLFAESIKVAASICARAKAGYARPSGRHRNRR